MASHFNANLSNSQAITCERDQHSTMSRIPDPYSRTRGALLDHWIKAHGEANACLLGAGYEAASKDLHNRHSQISQARKKHGYQAALKIERDFHPIGMPAGYLTENLHLVSVDGSKVSDMRTFGAAYSVGEYFLLRDVAALLPLSRPIDVRLESDVHGILTRDAIVTIAPPPAPYDMNGKYVLAGRDGGGLTIGRYEATSGGHFDLISGDVVLDDVKHGLKVHGLCMLVLIKLVH